VKQLAYAAAAVLVVAGTLTGCGGDGPAVMPDVKSRRLDIALSDIERAGFDDEVEVLGGGVFGVVDESNWMVCDQEPRPGAEISTAPRLTVDRSCGGQDKLKRDDNDSGSKAEDKPKHRQKKSGSGGGASRTFVMPAVVGMNLQDAQDKLQSQGSFLLTQTDATGLDRFQVDDDNWKVCFQKPAPGTTVKLSRLVELGAVKLDEQCP
jgi:beta-lactam-binding protein with PASTA domain